LANVLLRKKLGKKLVKKPMLQKKAFFRIIVTVTMGQQGPKRFWEANAGHSPPIAFVYYHNL